MVHCWIFGLKWKSKSKFHNLSWNNIVVSFQKKKKWLHHGHKASYLFYFVFLATCEALGFQRVDYENICSKAENLPGLQLESQKNLWRLFRHDLRQLT